MFKPQGIIPAMVTPMTQDEQINEKELRAQVNRMVAAGVHGLFCLGTNGEFYALSLEEKLEVIRIVTDENKGRLPVYAGTGCITSRDTIYLSQKAKELGVDALSIITPYFVAVSQDEIYSHYKEIAEAVALPIVLYNIPMRTGNNIEYKTLQRLAEIENIVGIKDSSGNFDNMLRYIEETAGSVAVLSGNDSLILSALMAGGTGSISGIANLFPEILVKIYELWQKGDIEGAKTVQGSLRPIRDTLKLGNPNSIVKRAMNLLGYQVGPARRPAAGVSEKADEAILKALEYYK
ncbi:4-hydroxy-tetrahydrodipicolinate synthase [Sporomusa sp.]|uniref:4-hydroxy-tetrahydrodipicolinate synthase n=1 Tax=Sporomusa sp. TaxID=2078658 RepID=UPI002CA7E70A|nr:4-hydroxy-tetrahydrodipicolinate synthase [Sporomusa sp.]HWR42087.1 4-hydroxy-tetrahydrodipicolinate synthase [Sporomusa sp.]